MVCQCPFELAVINAAEGQWRQRMDVEPSNVESLQHRWRLHAALAAAEEKQLVDVDREGRRIVLELAVPAGDQLHR